MTTSILIPGAGQRPEKRCVWVWPNLCHKNSHSAHFFFQFQVLKGGVPRTDIATVTSLPARRPRAVRRMEWKAMSGWYEWLRPESRSRPLGSRSYLRFPNCPCPGYRAGTVSIGWRVPRHERVKLAAPPAISDATARRLNSRCSQSCCALSTNTAQSKLDRRPR
jgi:hypothetical protein